MKFVFSRISVHSSQRILRHSFQRTEIKKPGNIPSPSSDEPGKDIPQSSSAPQSEEVKIKKEPVETSETNPGSSSEVNSGTFIAHDEQQERDKLGTCDSIDIAVSRDVEENKEKSDTESEIVVSDELQSAARIEDSQKDKKCSHKVNVSNLAVNDDKSSPEEKVQNSAEKGGESNSKIAEEPEPVEILDVEMEETEEVKTKEEMEAKPGEIL